ncbi:hypothetical protein [Serratia aquatilis]|uniref:Lipoprotein n=1 Tax=Serratia aquatilis TaxID=1737515 RepID=A0ABV6E9L5_9GAMM
MGAKFILSLFLFSLLSFLSCHDAGAAKTGTITVKFGETTEDTFKKTHPTSVKVGFNKALKGNIYQEMPNLSEEVRKDIVPEDLEKVSVLFDENKDLVALQLKFNEDGFSVGRFALVKKYAVITEGKTIFGTKYIELYNEDVYIYLITPSYFSGSTLFFIRSDSKEKILRNAPKRILENKDELLEFMEDKCFTP